MRVFSRLGVVLRNVLAAVGVWLAAFIALFPLYWAVVTSLRPRDAELGNL